MNNVKIPQRTIFQRKRDSRKDAPSPSGEGRGEVQSLNGKEPPVTFVDLTHADGSAAGTEVIIKMPVITSP